MLSARPVICLVASAMAALNSGNVRSVAVKLSLNGRMADRASPPNICPNTPPRSTPSVDCAALRTRPISVMAWVALAPILI